MRQVSAIAALLISLAAPASCADWVLLKDGRVGRGSARGDPVEVLFRNGKTEKVPRERVAASRTDEEVRATVDGVIKALAAKDRVASHSKVLKELKHAATSRLVYHLKSKEKKRRLAALCGLELCWSSAARRPLIEQLAEKDRKVKDLVVKMVREKISRKQINAELPALIAEKNFAAAVPAFELAEQRVPEVWRIKSVMAHPEFHAVMERYLTRYYTPELTPATMKLLDSKEEKVRRAAVISLIHQGADGEAPRGLVRALLGDERADLREVAGEYMAWHGTGDELEALRAAAAKEGDPHARASLRAAVAMIELRGKRPAPPKRKKAGKQPPAPGSYADAWLLLRANPTEAVRLSALNVYRRREKFEPRLRYMGKNAGEKHARERNARMLLTAEVFGFPGTARSRDAWRPKKVPVAEHFSWPVRDYYHPKRKSFGAQTGTDGKAGKVFGNSAHVGDDVAWLKDQRTVVAIADGAVRRVCHVQSWGFIVIVEHKLPGDEKWCCSLYAHLAPSVCVKPGQIVKRGQKIGATGRSMCWENGGYWSHLHFGLHAGPYFDSHPVGRLLDYTLNNGVEVEGVVVQRGDPFAKVKVSYKGQSVTFDVKQEANWICGYISKPYWKGGKHGWLDPQKFIRARLDDAGVKRLAERLEKLEKLEKAKKKAKTKPEPKKPAGPQPPKKPEVTPAARKAA